MRTKSSWARRRQNKRRRDSKADTQKHTNRDRQ